MTWCSSKTHKSIVDGAPGPWSVNIASEAGDRFPVVAVAAYLSKKQYVDGLTQDYDYSRALAMELLQSYANPAKS